MSIQTGDTVTIRRGKLANQTGTVVALAEGQAVLQLASQELSVQKLTNVRAPEQPTITADALALHVRGTVSEAGTIYKDDLVTVLEVAMPGFAKAYENASQGVRDRQE